MTALSIIIPSYNDGTYVQQLIGQIGHLRDTEIIVVESGDTSYFPSITHPQTRLYKGSKGRAVQMNYGARLSKGDVLWFLHADSDISELSPDRLKDVKQGWGSFVLRFPAAHPYLRVIETWSKNRARYFQAVFGDQGLFVSRPLFESIGGFVGPFEDINISRKLKKIKPNIVIEQPLYSSPRRLLKHGPLFAHAIEGAVIFLYALGLTSLAQKYWKMLS